MAVLVFIASQAVLALPVLFVALVLAGPHSDVLPGFLRAPVLAVSWAVLLGVPSFLAIRVYKRQAGPQPPRGGRPS